jgi:hypothetical protein
MARIADYVVITDIIHELNKNTARPKKKKFRFTLESGAHVHARAVLAFVLEVESARYDLRFDVQINDNAQPSHTLSGSRPSSTLHEVVNSDMLKADGENEIEFILEELDGRGKVRLSDVVLYYKRDI